MNKEKFLPIKDFEGLYEISNAGRVRSLKRKVKCRDNYRTVRERILKSIPNSHGYLKVLLCKDGKKKTYLIHQLVMNHFKPNPNPEIYTEIIHIRNGDKLCNFVTSLRRVTPSENQIKNYKRNDGKPAGIKAVLQIDKTGKIIAEFKSIKEAQRITGVNQGNICKCCKGKLKSIGSFIWKYKPVEKE